VSELRGRDRLIVPLDVPTRDAALALVEALDGVTDFFKIGWELFVAGEWRPLLEDLRGKQVFLDLKVPADIGNTIARVVQLCAGLGVRFLTLSDSRNLRATVRAAREARSRAEHPRLLAVPYLSSLDQSDLDEVAGKPGARLSDYVLERSRDALDAGCDGLIASGQEIRLLRDRFGERTIIVSPGIRPAGSPAQDHKRVATPAEAIELGADYLVVGRPIREAPDPRAAAQQIVAEIDRALDRQPPGTRKRDEPRAARKTATPSSKAPTGTR